MPFSAYSTIGIGLHTDASYYCQPMGIQIFHVLDHDGNGGATMLSDGFSGQAGHKYELIFNISAFGTESLTQKTQKITIDKRKRT